MPNEDQFAKLWVQFYDAACMELDASMPTAMSGQKNNGDDEGTADTKLLLLDRIESFLRTIQKFTFGADDARKAIVVADPHDACGLVVRLYDAYAALDREGGTNNNARVGANKQGGDEKEREVILGFLKTIKSIVVRNPAGRVKCRLVGVYPGVLKRLFEHRPNASDTIQDPIVADEVVTTLAAICLGDTDNALVGSEEFEPILRSIASAHAQPSSPTPGDEVAASLSPIEQKLKYLTALFEAVRQERSEDGTARGGMSCAQPAKPASEGP